MLVIFCMQNKTNRAFSFWFSSDFNTSLCAYIYIKNYLWYLIDKTHFSWRSILLSMPIKIRICIKYTYNFEKVEYLIFESLSRRICIDFDLLN